MPDAQMTTAFLCEWSRDRTGRVPEPDASLMELGLDSFDIVALVDALRSFSGATELSILEILEHPTLAALAAHVAVDEGAGSAGAGPLQARLVAWVEGRLGRSVDPAVPFAELGLDSFDIVALADELREATGDDSLSLLTVIEYPSIVELVSHVGGGGGSESIPEVVLRATGAALGAPSLAQASLLAWEACREPSPTFTAGIRFTLDGVLDSARLQRAVEALVARQGALRQCARRGADRFTTCAPEDIRVASIDVGGAPEAQVMRLYQEIMSSPFLLDGGPLFRCHLLRISADRSDVVLTWHHAVHDATGGGLLVEELLALLAVGGRIDAADLPVLPISYADYVAWEGDFYASARGRDLVAQERERIAGFQGLDLPRRPLGAPITARAHGSLYRLRPDEVDAFSGYLRSQSATFFATCTAATAVVLAARTGSRRIPVLSPVGARQAAEVRHLVGRFGARVPVLLSLDGDPTFDEIVHAVTQHNRYLLAPVPDQLVLDTLDVFEHPLAQVVVNAPSLADTESAYPSAGPGLVARPAPLWQPTVCPPHLAMVFGQKGRFMGVKTVGQAGLYDTDEVHGFCTDLHGLLTRVRSGIRLSELGAS